MCDAFFSPKYSKRAKYFSPKNLQCTCYFSSVFCVKNGGKFQLPSAHSQLLVNPNTSELAVLRNKITTPRKNLSKTFFFFLKKNGILKIL